MENIDIAPSLVEVNGHKFYPYDIKSCPICGNEMELHDCYDECLSGPRNRIQGTSSPCLMSAKVTNQPLYQFFTYRCPHCLSEIKYKLNGNSFYDI